ncbi:MAG TPA: carboxypeptidase-like regulatory domain-containing protein, partial [Pyrinomonadaceae bacterium]
MSLSSARRADRASRFRLPPSGLAATLLLLVFAPLATAYAQGGGGTDSTGTGGKHTIQGHIYFPSGQRADTRARVKLQSMHTGDLTVLADINGTFSFKSLAPGSYTIVVEGGGDYETAKESIYIDGEASNPRTGIVLPTTTRTYQVQIYLQPKQAARPGGKPGVLNAALAGVPPEARELYQKGLASSQAGDG